MSVKVIEFKSIGVVRTGHTELRKIPVQPVYCQDVEGRIELDEEYADGLKGLEEFSHIFVFFEMHGSTKMNLQLQPYLSDEMLGVFATRTPHRPNKLGMSVVRVERVEGATIYVKEIDILDGSAVIDIKPYVQRFDQREDVRSGWQDRVSDEEAGVRAMREAEKGK